MTPLRRANDKEEQQVYSTICKPAMDKISDEITTIREKIFNGHSSSIERIEREVGEIKKMMLGMIIGCFTILVSIVIYVVFGISI